MITMSYDPKKSDPIILAFIYAPKQSYNQLGFSMYFNSALTYVILVILVISVILMTLKSPESPKSVVSP